MREAEKRLSLRVQAVTAESRGLVDEAHALLERLQDLREELDLKLVEWRDFDLQAENDLKRIRQKGLRR